jgi:hypothetical protein
MKTGAKIAIGCVVAVVVVGGAAVIGVVGLGYWAKQKVTAFGEKAAGDQKQVNTYLEQARAHPFTQPTDGVITEAELVRFLDVRKRVFAVYQKYGQQLEELDKKKAQGGVAALQAVSTLMGAFGEIRMTQAQALAEVGMNPQEYAYLVGNVYRTYYASLVAQQSGGRQMSQVMGDLSKQIADATPPAVPNEDPAAARARQQQIDQLKQQFQQMSQQAKVTDVPQANLDLFKKYETEIKKYVMPGLEGMEAVQLGLTQ